MQIGILGPLRVVNGGSNVAVSGERLRGLLIRLALDSDRSVSVDALIDALWGDRQLADEINALQSLVSRLRRLLGTDIVVATSNGYRLAVPTDVVDAHRFSELVKLGQASLSANDNAAAQRTLTAALELWRGPALTDVAGAAYAAAPATRLEELRLTAVETRARADLRLGQFDAAIGELTALVADHPLRETGAALLIEALEAAGRPADALGQYERIRGVLADELGLDPSPKLREAHLAVLRRAAEPAETHNPGRPRQPLRSSFTSFIGRAEEIDGIERKLAVSRLVTLVVPGGAGKTRLSTEAGERVALGYRDGVHLIELAPVTNADDVPRVVLGRLGMRESNLLDTPQRTSHRDVVAQLTDALRDKQMLLLFDNCEHLIEPVARLIELLLANSPRLRVIATSREPLAIFGEALHPVPPLSQPSAGASPADALESHAVQLFADRAASVRPGFAVDDSTVASVAEICRRLDGLPLAIELAAARLRKLSVGHIAERLSDRFRLLNVGSRTAMPRHQTLGAVVEWSWDLLTDDERCVAERLAVFPAGVTPDSCAAVCPDLRLSPNGPDDVLDLLGALADKSLLQQVEAGDDPRYRMLETIREYGIERLDERGERLRVQAWHSSYFLTLAREADPHLRSSEQLFWLGRLNAEHGNLLAALRYAIEAGDADTAVRLTAALTWYWVLLGSHAEAATWAKQALGVPGETDDEARAVTIAAYGINVAISGESDTAESLIPGLSELADRLDARSGNPVIAVIRPGVAMVSGREDTAIAEITALLDHPDRWTRAMLRAFRSAVYENCGDFERMRDDREAALAEFREIGDRWGMATTLSELVIVWQVDPQRLPDAIVACEDALRLSRELGANGDISQLLVRLAALHLRSGDRRAAEVNLLEADTVVARFGSVESMAMVRAGWIGWHYTGGAMAEARRLAELTIAEADQISNGFPHLRSVLRANTTLVAAAQGDTAAAKIWLREAFPIAMSTNDQPIIARIAVATAGYLVRFGVPSLAVELLAAGAVLRGVEDATDLDIAAVADAARTALGDKAYEAAYAKGGALDKDAALALLRQTVETL